MRRDPIRAAVVGAGLMGRWHADALVRAGGRLSLVVDADPQRARRLAARYPNCRATTTLGADAGDSIVDVVHICTPTDTHETLASQAVQNHMRALVEKPL